MKTDALKIELAALRIPVFDVPWAGACSPHAQRIETRMLEWADDHGLLVNDMYRKRVMRTRYGWLAARCYPNADPALLQVIADYFVWYFLTDDLFIDRVETLGPGTLTHLVAIVDVLDYDQTARQPVYGERAWLDVCRRLRARLSAEHFARFAQGMRLWATTAGLQILNHIHAESVGIPQYETIRRHTSGMNPCLALADTANCGAVPPDTFHRPDVQELCRHANHIVCWSNDIQSLGIEARQPGQFRNMVLIRRLEGHTLQEGVDYTAARVRDEIGEFVRCADALSQHADTRVRGLVDGCRYWIRGYLDWVARDTQRYAAAYADDADDRGLIAPSGSVARD
ncbi:sesquiterpene cyclase [Burkholderia sp. MSh2]|uniref:Terpene synthase n=1 Tax=Burkholderia paludis TaxID=1506587 RepID=A0A6J5EVY8_9BURK|nr:MULTISPECIES: sesquiterpene cyclase [Burkholderia]KEZ02877.1 sesquiterpene cyclase [Burkholderia sp. MSh2]KEZ02936.1 sesquiterpene cyclase [Burkholderia sp. MSh2]KFG92939.1 sesquiterpene cyclase [Burkholderia paludis]CAB3769366.1 (+)-corvol ether B synthase/(+)-corvol ether A synthase ((2E,6E)-farnesyl diphosphate cyclizing) [Burkholderia paludis]VWC06703.1 terpene synthase [Burkholderia paludis]